MRENCHLTLSVVMGGGEGDSEPLGATVSSFGLTFLGASVSGIVSGLAETPQVRDYEESCSHIMLCQRLGEPIGSHLPGIFQHAKVAGHCALL